MLTEAGPIEPLRGVRRAMAQRMTQARDEVAPATVIDDADVDAWPEDADVSVRLVRAVVAGCIAEPSLNAWYDSREAGRRLHAKIDIGIAVDTEDGLFVPVLRDAGNRDAADLRSGLDRMKADSRLLLLFQAPLANFGQRKLEKRREVDPVYWRPVLTLFFFHKHQEPRALRLAYHAPDGSLREFAVLGDGRACGPDAGPIIVGIPG